MRPSRLHQEPRAALAVGDRSIALRNLPTGALFEDCNGQQFAKLGEIAFRRGAKTIKRQVIQCLWSPYGRREPGPVSSAFFTHIGAVLYLRQNQPVHPAAPVLALAA